MKPKSTKERDTRPSVNPASAVDAAIRDQVSALVTEIHRYSEKGHQEPLPDADAPCSTIKERLDDKRQELQTLLDTTQELKQRLRILSRLPPPDAHELRVRVLLLKGSAFDFTRLGRADQRERLDLALQSAAQIFDERWDIALRFGQPEVIEKETAWWELTPDELWHLGERYASQGTPALLFADRVLLPDGELPHSWGHADHSIACVTETQEKEIGQVTAHNVAHLLGLDDGPRAQHLMSHAEMGLQLDPGEVERLRERVSQRAARWVAENAAAVESGEATLDLAQNSVIWLEGRGDRLWQRYQTCLEKQKATPPHGVNALSEAPTPPPVDPELAFRVERLTQQIARAERELATAKEQLAEILDQLRGLGGEEGKNR